MTDTLTELKRLRDEATPGEWEYKAHPGVALPMLHIYCGDGKGTAHHDRSPLEAAANAALIVAAVNALPKLLEMAEACGKLLKAIDAGRMRQRVGVTGQTMDAQLRACVYDRVPAYPVEEAREKYALALASLKGVL